jgi:hypothetical protein
MPVGPTGDNDVEKAGQTSGSVAPSHPNQQQDRLREGRIICWTGRSVFGALSGGRQLRPSVTTDGSRVNGSRLDLRREGNGDLVRAPDRRNIETILRVRLIE